ncbi:uroporphyrinogen-III C-methyltransferase [Thioclava sp. GXIMD2076]|uniref:uroporphyrinogen-III C-methyltransferase n=1 Tax=Thioclava sp. GXIMD2076 TaxID=3131931 RepID=UPI0030D6163C
MSQSQIAKDTSLVTFAGAGPGSADHVTLAVARALESADIVLHDALVGPEVLDLIGAQATRIRTGKQGFGPSMAQDEISALIVGFALQGRRVLRLKSGDASVFGRLNEEIAALEAHGIGFRVLPGVTSASAASAAIGQSLTERGRNSELRILTGHDTDGYTDSDWARLAAPGTVAAFYMGKKASRFIQGRLMMHGAAPSTPVTLVENVSQPDQRIWAANLATLPDQASLCQGPTVILFGLAPRAAVATLSLTDLHQPDHTALEVHAREEAF